MFAAFVTITAVDTDGNVITDSNGKPFEIKIGSVPDSAIRAMFNVNKEVVYASLNRPGMIEAYSTGWSEDVPEKLNFMADICREMKNNDSSVEAAARAVFEKNPNNWVAQEITESELDPGFFTNRR